MIRCAADDYSVWHWVNLDKHDQPTGEPGSGDLKVLATQAKGRRLILVLPGRSVLITSVELPEGGNRVISSAIPYALEEQMAEDIEFVHFARGRRLADGSIPVVAVSKRLLSDLLKLLSDAGLQPAQTVAEPLLLPWQEGQLSLVIRGDMVRARQSETEGFECTLDQLPALLQSLLVEREGQGYEKIHIWRQESIGDLRFELEQVCDELIETPSSSSFSELTELGSKPQTVNLLQGFGESDAAQISRGNWWPAVAMILLAIGIHLAITGYQYNAVQSELRAVTKDSRALFRETFPDVKRLVRPIVQARQKLDQRRLDHGQGTDNLLGLLSVLGAVKQQNKTIAFKNLEYRQKSLVIHLEGKSVAQIEKFKQQLESTGKSNSEILSTVSRGEVIEARIKLKAHSA